MQVVTQKFWEEFKARNMWPTHKAHASPSWGPFGAKSPLVQFRGKALGALAMLSYILYYVLDISKNAVKDLQPVGKYFCF